MPTKRKIFYFCLALSILLVASLLLGYCISEEVKIMKEKVSEAKTKNIRQPAVAGSFYPSDQAKLRKQLDSFFETADANYNNENIKALIVPHAGYIYSGETAMQAYKQLYYDLLLREEKSYKIIILAPSHTEYFKGIATSSSDFFRTPLGNVKLAESQLSDLNKDSAHKKEHSIEVQLPFLQYIFEKTDINFEILPIVISDVDPKYIAKLILPEITDNTIIIASSDLSHYSPQETAEKIDQQSISSILNNKTDIDACGVMPILVLNEIAKQKNWSKRLLKYSTSGDSSGDYSSVVGYASFSYFSNNNKPLLVRLARRSIFNSLYGLKDNFEDLKKIIPKEHLKKQGTFVTLTINGQLRGCIGNIIGTKSIFDGVIGNAKAAAFDDFRFEQLSEDEFKAIDIEVSILSEPKDCNLSDIKKGDGVILQQGYYQAVYLPQVWEQLPNKDVFLGSLCEKAGLDWSCYNNKKTSFKKFQVKIVE